jgi:epsilon-lactone hydrolase
VPTRIVTPHGKSYDPDRVLINLHGGAFSLCANACAMLESIPVSVLGSYKVVTVNYREAPEAKHPAAVEDVASVYSELLKHYKPNHIGIYGCSAGGALTAQAASWLPAHGLPQAGAVGIFGAGAVRFESGDSAWVAAYIDGSFPPPPRPGAPRPDMTHGYFAGADMKDAIISPALHPDTLAKFPPTLIITGTRAMDMSPAVYTNSQLIKAGVHSTLIVGEGMGHCYIYQSQLPEAQDGVQAIVNFFRENLR